MADKMRYRARNQICPTLFMAHPDFRDPTFMLAHARSIFDFYHPRAIDPTGGFFHYFKDDGTVYDRQSRHLVSSCRFVFVYARAATAFNDPGLLSQVRHGLDYLRNVHRNPATGGYAWQLHDGKPVDATNHCYGLAFVLLAGATALASGVEEGRDLLQDACAVMDHRFWSETDGLYADEAAADWHLSSYRGQNANMHTCEALIAAHAATGECRFLDRAVGMARRVTVDLASQCDGLIWEHYDERWTVDPDYNRDNPKHLFRPWGFQPGHQTEWAKLLLQLHEQTGERWMVDRARSLFDRALATAWDNTYGGICYGFAPDGTICDDDKYFWVQAESFAAAARLAVVTGEQTYWDWYDRIWEYAWDHLVDHRHGAWYRILTRDGRSYSDEKSPAGKTDYHTLGAALEVRDVLLRSAV